MTIEKVRPSPYAHVPNQVKDFVPQPQSPPPVAADAVVKIRTVEMKAPETGKIVKISATVGQDVQKDQTILFEIECDGAASAAAPVMDKSGLNYNHSPDKSHFIVAAESEELMRKTQEKVAQILQQARENAMKSELEADAVLQQAQTKAQQIIAAARSAPGGATVGDAEGFRMSTVQVTCDVRTIV
jgi:multidrug efflux pump subunit AcrA (membrane-fusion protein)